MEPRHRDMGLRTQDCTPSTSDEELLRQLSAELERRLPPDLHGDYELLVAAMRGLPEVAAMFHEAYQLVHPHLSEIRRPGGGYHGVMERSGHMKRLNELSDRACAVLGEPGIYRHWAAYARQHPERVFSAEPCAAPNRRPARQRATRPARRGGGRQAGILSLSSCVQVRAHTSACSLLTPPERAVKESPCRASCAFSRLRQSTTS